MRTFCHALCFEAGEYYTSWSKSHRVINTICFYLSWNLKNKTSEWIKSLLILSWQFSLEFQWFLTKIYMILSESESDKNSTKDSHIVFTQIFQMLTFNYIYFIILSVGAYYFFLNICKWICRYNALNH